MGKISLAWTRAGVLTRKVVPRLSNKQIKGVLDVPLREREREKAKDTVIGIERNENKM